MPQVNISTLTGLELRQLLDASRRRGDAALSYKVLQEMAARRQVPVQRGRFTKRHPAEPRLVAVELGDPMEKDDLPPLPNWRPPAREAEEVAVPTEPEAVAAVGLEPPSPSLEAGRPLSLHDAVSQPPPDQAADAADPGLRLHPVELESSRAPRRPRLRGVAGFALGILIGIALGWWGGRIAREEAPPPAAPILTAALTSPPAPALVLAPPVSSAAEPAPDALADPAAAPTPPAPPTAETEVDGATQPAPNRSAPDRAAPAVADGCAAQPTPADRAICGDPQLQRLQGELRRAYAEALAAHQDRDLLRQRQLAWRDARNTISDPDRLAQMYEARIRKLNAATAQARQPR